MAIGGESYCVRHNSVMAVGRCRQCGVPFCGECHVDASEGDYCSIECRAKHKRFSNRAEELAWKRPSRLVQRAFSFVVLVVVIAVALHFLGVNVPVVSDLLRGQ